MAIKSLPKEEVKLPRPTSPENELDGGRAKPETDLPLLEKSRPDEQIEASVPKPPVHQSYLSLKLLALFLVIVLFVASGFVLFQNNAGKTLPPTPTPSIANQNTSVLWNVSKQNLNPEELELKNFLLAYNYPKYPLTTKLSISTFFVSSVSSNFAYADGICLGDKNQDVQPTCTFIYFLHKNNNTWSMVALSDKNSCDVIKTFPSDIVTQNLKDYLIGCFPK